MDVYAGIDAGGTRTRALISNEQGSVMGYGMGGPGNPHNLAGTNLAENYAEAVSAAMKGLGRDATLHAIFVGAAGVKAERDRALVRNTVANRLGMPLDAVEVQNDCQSALAGGLAGRPGTVVIAGTGSHAFARSRSGVTAYCGGWGCLLDDVGSGYWVGLQALRIAARQADCREPETPLMRTLFAKLGVEHPFDLLPRIYIPPMPVSEIASLAPVVIDCAAAGDGRALRLLEEGVDGLCQMVEGAARATGGIAEPLELVLAGGLAESDSLYGRMLREGMLRLPCVSRITPPEFPPVCGSLILALQQVGKEPSQALLDRLSKFDPRKAQG